MTDLNRLIAAVDANYILQMTDAVQVFPPPLWRHACKASHGSLDAALALKDALLPGVSWHLWQFPDDAGCNIGLEDTSYAPTPPRALLLATLRALDAIRAADPVTKSS